MLDIRQGFFRRAIAFVVVFAPGISVGILTTWPTDGPVEVTGNYGMTEQDTSGVWIHHSEVDINGAPDTTVVRAVKDGMIWLVVYQEASDDSIFSFELASPSDTMHYAYGHIRPLEPSSPDYVDMTGVRYLDPTTWVTVTESQPLAHIRAPNDTLNTVSHPHVAFAASPKSVLIHDSLSCHTLNPLIEYGNLDPTASDGDDLPDIH
jgi:hypothetical protein